ncbi:MAG: PepSY domain-containing protein [Sandaracinaceae bacterium]|nr:PepSY domain-containing protein [Sandaracinaceae bacterium]
MTKWIYALAAAAGLALASPVALAEDVTMEQLPQPVRQTLQRELGQAQVHEMERDRDGDRVVYEIEIIDGGQKFELDIAEDGRLLSRRPD